MVAVVIGMASVLLLAAALVGMLSRSMRHKVFDAQAFAVAAESRSSQLSDEMSKLKRRLADQKGELASMRAKVDALSAPASWSALVGSEVLLNDVSGDGYVGLMVAADHQGVRLEGIGGKKVKVIDGKNEHVVELPWVNLPADKVKFAAGAG